MTHSLCLCFPAVSLCTGQRSGVPLSSCSSWRGSPGGGLAGRWRRLSSRRQTLCHLLCRQALHSVTAQIMDVNIYFYHPSSLFLPPENETAVRQWQLIAGQLSMAVGPSDAPNGRFEKEALDEIG